MAPSIKKHSHLLLVIFCVIFSIQSMAQQKPSSREQKALSVGDLLPPHTMKVVDQKDLHLYDFKDKLVILDFWSFSCSACVASWPKLLSLQEQFPDDLQIILVNVKETSERIREFVKKRKALTGVDMTLPLVYKDTVLKNMFPYSGLPHVVWIDQESKVAAISDGGAINAKNIQTVLDKKKLKLARKIRNDELIIPNWRKPLFINGNGGHLQDNEAIWFSLLTKGKELIWPTYGHDRNIVFSTNAGIKALYQLAYSDRHHALGSLIPLLDNRVSLHATDSSKYLSVIGGEIQRENMYIYQLVAPPETSTSQLKERFQSDLKFNFRLNVSWKKETKMCYVISRSAANLTVYKEGPKSHAVGSTKINVNNLTVGQFISRLEEGMGYYYYSTYPFVDETGYEGLLGRILFEGNIENVDELSKKLEPFGMKITREMRSIDVLQLRETEESLSKLN